MCREEYPRAALLIDRNMFTDDFIAGVDDRNEAIRVYYDLTTLMKTIKLPMAKWATSCEELRKFGGQRVQTFRGQHKPWA
jgi:hypothetical protein